MQPNQQNNASPILDILEDQIYRQSNYTQHKIIKGDKSYGDDECGSRTLFNI